MHRRPRIIQRAPYSIALAHGTVCLALGDDLKKVSNPALELAKINAEITIVNRKLAKLVFPVCCRCVSFASAVLALALIFDHLTPFYTLTGFCLATFILALVPILTPLGSECYYHLFRGLQRIDRVYDRRRSLSCLRRGLHREIARRRMKQNGPVPQD